MDNDLKYTIFAIGLSQISRDPWGFLVVCVNPG